MDCKVLMDGYEVVRSWMSEHAGLDIDHHITIQSLASDFCLRVVAIIMYFKLADATIYNEGCCWRKMYDSK